MATKKKSGSAKAWELGGAVTAAALAAAAGAYLLSDKKTKARAKKWVVSARKEVAKNAKIAKKLGAKEYARIVDQAIKHYGPLEKMAAAEMLAAGKDLKGEWKRIHAEAKKMASKYTPKKAAKKKPVRRARPTKKARG